MEAILKNFEQGIKDGLAKAREANTEEQLVRLSPAVECVMSRCRADLGRQMDAFDFCELCPLLAHCHAQEHEPNASVTVGGTPHPARGAGQEGRP